MPRLQRCTAITTGSESSPRTNNETSETGFQSYRRNARAGAKEEEEDDLEAEEERLDDLLPKTIKRSKPFKYVYEKEIVMYAYFKVSATIPSLASPLRGQSFETECSPSGRFGQKLDYHSTECIYAPTAYRGYARALVKDLEAVRPSAIVDLVRFLSHPSLPPSHETRSCPRSRALIHTDISQPSARAADLLRRSDGREPVPARPPRGRRTRPDLAGAGPAPARGQGRAEGRGEA